MTKVPSPFRAPAEIQSEHDSAPTSHRNSRCKDCGAPLDVWNCCPNLPASEARLRSSVQESAYCGRASSQPWNFAVDMPGVGRVSGVACAPVGHLNLRGTEYRPGEVPPSLNRLLDGDLSLTLSPLDVVQLQDFTEAEGKRDRLFCELLFAARDLAEAQEGRPWMGQCCECQAFCRYQGDPIVHRPTCRVGRVVAILQQLAEVTKLDPTFTPKGKEAAPDGEKGREGDGVCPRGLRFAASKGGAQ
jgi:hypothetical protein